MSNSSFEQNQEIIKTKNNDVKNESHFKGNQERNKLLLILIIIGIVIFGIPVFSGLLGIVIGIVGGLFGVTLGSFCAGVGCLIGAVFCGIWFDSFIIWIFLDWKNVSKTYSIFV